MSQTRERGGFEYVVSHVPPVYLVHARVTGLLGRSVCAQAICSCLTVAHINHVVPTVITFAVR